MRACWQPVLALLLLAHGAGALKRWPAQAALPGLDADACVWKTVQPPRSTAYDMCLRDKDMVSDNIRQHGSWPDCNFLLTAWQTSLNITRDSIFVDAGTRVSRGSHAKGGRA